jgi:chromate transporter
MSTPALLIIPLVHFVGRRMDHPRVKGVLQTVVIASAGLLLAAAIPLARDALTDSVTVAIAVVSLALLLVTKIDSLWIILGAAVISLLASSIGVPSQISG